MQKLIVSLIIIPVLGISSCSKKNDTLIPNKIVEKSLSIGYKNRLDTVMDSICNSLGIKGVSASVIVPNVGIWKKSHGISHSGTAINSDMIFPIGSNTKTFTAAVILKLQEQGKLNIHDTIGKWIQMPNVSGKITIYQLMNHTSGLYNYTEHPSFGVALISDFNRIYPEENSTISEFLLPANANPGTKYEYCNTNYYILGSIIRKVIGKPIKDVMREIIFAPSYLGNTFYYPFEEIIGIVPHFWSNQVSGNLEDLNEIYNYSPKSFNSLASTAGCIYSTAYDNSKFWFNLMNEKIINRNSLKIMQQFLTVDNNESYGLGIKQLQNYNGTIIIFHDGTVVGGTNSNAYDKKSGVIISVHTNQDVLDPTFIVKALHKVTTQYQ